MKKEMMETEPDSDERRAVHEAGHALVAYCVSWPFAYVTIEFDPLHPDFRGHVRYARLLANHLSGADPWTVHDFRKVIAAFWGGWAGEYAIFGQAGTGSDHDRGVIRHALEHVNLPNDEREAINTSSLDLANFIVVNARESLGAIAKSLGVHRTLQFPDVETIVRENTPASILNIVDSE